MRTQAYKHTTKLTDWTASCSNPMNKKNYKERLLECQNEAMALYKIKGISHTLHKGEKNSTTRPSTTDITHKQKYKEKVP